MAHHVVVRPCIGNICSACDYHVVCLYDAEAQLVWAVLQSPALGYDDHCGSLDMRSHWIRWKVPAGVGLRAVWEDLQAPLVQQCLVAVAGTQTAQVQGLPHPEQGVLFPILGPEGPVQSHWVQLDPERSLLESVQLRSALWQVRCLAGVALLRSGPRLVAHHPRKSASGVGKKHIHAHGFPRAVVRT
jgi:hypothetical protein